VYCTLHCTFTVYFFSLSLVRMKVRDSEVLAWVRGQRKTSQVLDAFGLLDFTILRPVLVMRAFWKLWTVYFFNFPIFFSGHGKPRILNQWIRGHDCTYNPVYSSGNQHRRHSDKFLCWKNVCPIFIRERELLRTVKECTSVLNRKHKEQIAYWQTCCHSEAKLQKIVVL
jgi:hypothetical protein